jgi:hypothetical protein
MFDRAAPMPWLAEMLDRRLRSRAIADRRSMRSAGS